MEEISTTGEEHPSTFKSEDFVLPEDTFPASFRKQKRISVWQIVILLLLFVLAIGEKDMTNDGNVFTLVFILTLWGVMQRRRILPDRARVFVDSWWHPCAVRLRALHIKLVQGRRTPPAVNEICTCLNCGTIYNGSYCFRCGQSRNTTRYRFSIVLKNIVVSFFKVNNEFGRTLMELVYRPGYMIRDFLGGKRVKYCSPFQSLFILSALYIMAVQLVDPAALSMKENVGQTEKEEIAAAKYEVSRDMEKVYGKMEKRTLSIAMNHLDKILDKQDEKKDSVYSTRKYGAEDKDDNLFVKFIKDTSEVNEKMERFFSKSTFLMNVCNTLERWGHGNKALRIILTLPLFAFATRLAFRRRKNELDCTGTEHVIIQAYIACQILLMSIIVLPFNGYAMVNNLYELPLWFIFVLFCWDYKQLYHCTWWRSFWGTVLMLIYSLVILILFACLVTALTLVGVYVLNSIL